MKIQNRQPWIINAYRETVSIGQFFMRLLIYALYSQSSGKQP
jgi:hypothetical protein